MSENANVESDAVDDVLNDWARSRPEIDVSGLAVVGRIIMIAKHFQRIERRALKRFGLDPWAFDVLASLRRQGPPFELSPTDLRHLAILSSGAMTNRLDRLEERGLVTRRADPVDRRSIVITLSPEGVELVDLALASRLEAIDKVLIPLSRLQRGEAIKLLRPILANLTA